MSRSENSISPYSQKQCRKALLAAFRGLKFDCPGLKPIMQDSYFYNLGILCEYARDNGIDEKEYILGIRDELIRSGTAHERK